MPERTWLWTRPCNDPANCPHGSDPIERVEYVRADLHRGAVGMLKQIATDLERELDVGGRIPTVFPNEIRALLARIAPQTRP